MRSAPPTASESASVRLGVSLAAVSKVLAALAVACGVVAWSIYFWPDVTIRPRPESGHVYAVRSHYDVLYWTRTEVWLHYVLSIVGGLLFVAALVIAVRLGVVNLGRRRPGR